MKILYLNPLVSNDPNNLYGAMLHAHEFIKAARELGHQIEVYPGSNPPVTVRLLSYLTNKAESRFPSLEYLLKYYSGKVQHGVNAGTFEFLRRHAGVIVARTSILNMYLLKQLSCEKVPYLIEMNALLYEEKKVSLSQTSFKKLKNDEFTVLKKASRIMVVSRKLKQDLVNAGFHEKNIFFLPNGVDSGLFNPSVAPISIERVHHPGTDFTTVGFLGNMMTGVTDIGTLLLSVSRLVKEGKKIHLVLAGRGTTDQDLMGVIQSEGIVEHVTQLGPIPYPKAPSYLAAMDILVSPFRKHCEYVLPLKEFSYMSMAKPIVATRRGHKFDILQNRKTALLVDPEDERQMADAISYFIDHPGEAKTMGQAARYEILAKYTWKHNAERVINACRTVISEKT
jgi:glycosyltransferase involved in cell wall biosynthesis